MKARVSLSVKILLLSFLNVVLLALIFAIFARVQYRFDLSSLLLSPGRDRILSLSRLIALQLPGTDRKDWDHLLAGYSTTTHASACLFDQEGKQLAGPKTDLPPAVQTLVRHDIGVRVMVGPPPPPAHGETKIQSAHGPPPPPPTVSGEGPPPVNGAPSPPHVVVDVETLGPNTAWLPPAEPGEVTVRVQHGPTPPGGDWQYEPGHPPKPLPYPVFLVSAGKPTRYWVGVHIPVMDRATMRPEDATLLWTFSSLWTNPFFFDYTPWLVAALVVILVSAACWLPLIRGLTRSISQLTDATGAIAEGKLETRSSLRRRDELGRLSESINRMAERLSGYVHGQRRFLSDVAHELCSPIARIQVSLGILDQRAGESQKQYVAGVQEEMEHMSGLVNELLLFSRAQINAAGIPLTRVNVAETVSRVVERESGGEARIETNIDAGLEVKANPEYLFRSLSNVVRNAVRYSAAAGPIVISAREMGERVAIIVADNGLGIPEAELEAAFKPFYRPELARQRETGGVGLGLAIVRTCIEACGGAVTCHNRTPHGLEVEIQLPKASPASPTSPVRANPRDF